MASLLLTSLGLGFEGLGTLDLGLSLVDVLHQDGLVLELVTLALVVKNVVEVLVDFGGGTVFTKHSAKNAHASDPDGLGREAGFTSTGSLTTASVASLGLGLSVSLVSGRRVNSIRLADDETILDELANILARVGVGDLVDLVRVQPHLALTAVQYGSGEALLQL